MKRRDFLLAATGLLLFPANALAKTTVKTERCFARNFTEIQEKPVIDPEPFYDAPEMPIIEHPDLIMMYNNMDEREATNRIIVHHTGNAKDVDMSARDVHLLHKYDFGWAGGGYHYVIRKDGRIEATRPENLVGAHAYSNNGDSIGIALAGNFNLGYPTDYQMKSLIALSLYLADKYALNLTQTGVLQGHRDVNDTACPGNNLYNMLDYVRDSVV